eukprot:m.401205 g.401205  ORF g.401205 m.401205 type:complete len:135 (-) comp56442_c0_seq3:369-773(-)
MALFVSVSCFLCLGLCVIAQMASRDYAVLRYWEKLTGATFSVFTGIDYSGRPASGYVRAGVRASGYVITAADQPGVLALTTISNISYAGWVPGFLEEQIAKSSAVQLFEDIRVAMAARLRARAPNTLHKSDLFV